MKKNKIVSVGIVGMLCLSVIVPTAHTQEKEIEPVSAVAFSPNGKAVLSASGDVLKLWDVATGKRIRRFGDTGRPVTCLVFSPDGKAALSGSEGEPPQLWDTTSGNLIRTFKGNGGGGPAVAFSPDGRTAASAGANYTIQLWDVATGTALRALSGHTSFISSVVFSPDGKKILSGSSDETMRLWDVSSGTAVRTFIGHDGSVEYVTFSPDGTRALSCSDDETVKLWDVFSGTVLRTYSELGVRIRSVSFSPDGKTGLSCADDETAKLWDVASGEIILSFTTGRDDIHSAEFSPDGRTVVSTGAFTPILWASASGKIIRRFTGRMDGSDPVTKVILSDAFDGAYVVKGETVYHYCDVGLREMLNGFAETIDDAGYRYVTLGGEKYSYFEGAPGGELGETGTPYERGYQYSPTGVASVTASSRLIEEKKGKRTEYGPEGLLCRFLKEAEYHFLWNSSALPWSEGAEGDGVGEYLDIEFEEPTNVFAIANGYIDFGKPYLFRDNGRVRRAVVSGTGSEGDFSFSVEFEDAVRFTEIKLPSAAKRVRFSIAEVYKGRKWNDTCVSAVLGFGLSEAKESAKDTVLPEFGE